MGVIKRDTRSLDHTSFVMVLNVAQACSWVLEFGVEGFGGWALE